MRYGFGIDVGGTTVKIGFFQENGILLRNWEIPTDHTMDGKNVLPDIAASVAACCKEADIPLKEILGAGVGVPGPVDHSGTVNRCINVGWGIVNIPASLSPLIGGVPVAAGNDANVAALGEAWMGGGKGFRSMVMATLGTGIGGGIILDGKILHGAHGVAGEIGHITIRRNETVPCNCGKCGCAEQYASATGIVRTARRMLEENPLPSVLRKKDSFSCKDVFDAGYAGDRLAENILAQVYDDIGLFLADACCVIDPEIIVLGGGVSKAGPRLLEGVRERYRHYMFHAGRDTPFALARLGNDAGIFGAFKMLLEQ